jgi:hypothetical protein
VEPKHPVGPAFDQASDKVAAWRKQQEAALNEEQKKEYARMQRAHNQALREHHEKFHDQRWELIDKEKNKLMLSKPTPGLRMLPTKGLQEARAYNMARAAVDKGHEIERATMEKQQQEQRDGFLYSAEVQRSQQAARSGRDADLTEAFRRRVEQRDIQRGRDDPGRERGR